MQISLICAICDPFFQALPGSDEYGNLRGFNRDGRISMFKGARGNMINNISVLSSVSSVVKKIRASSSSFFLALFKMDAERPQTTSTAERIDERCGTQI